MPSLMMMTSTVSEESLAKDTRGRLRLNFLQGRFHLCKQKEESLCTVFGSPFKLFHHKNCNKFYLVRPAELCTVTFLELFLLKLVAETGGGCIVGVTKIWRLADIMVSPLDQS